jgi:hypothetical protein
MAAAGPELNEAIANLFDVDASSHVPVVGAFA